MSFPMPVSYTHLDVYKRQKDIRPVRCAHAAATGLGDRLKLLGEAKDVWPVYAAAHAFCFSSRTDVYKRQSVCDLPMPSAGSASSVFFLPARVPT